MRGRRTSYLQDKRDHRKTGKLPVRGNNSVRADDFPELMTACRYFGGRFCIESRESDDCTDKHFRSDRPFVANHGHRPQHPS